MAHALLTYLLGKKPDRQNPAKPGCPLRTQPGITIMKKKQTPEVTGIIMPNNWDTNGKVTQIAIYTNAEEVYLVEHNRPGQELLNYINCRVEVSGKKSERLDGNRYIAVQKYVVLEELVEDENSVKS